MDEKVKQKGLFNMLDKDLQNYFIKQGLLCLAIILIGLFCVFLGIKIVILFFFLFIAFAYALFTYYRLVLCLKDKISFFEGKIVEIFDAKKEKKSYLGLNRNYIMVQQDDIYIKVYCPSLKDYRVENVIKVFVKEKAVTPLNEDTFVCKEPFLITVRQTGQYKQEGSEKDDKNVIKE